MPDLFALADLGRASIAALWIPLAAWTGVAALGEATLRLTHVPPTLAVRIRSALLLALPLALLIPAAVAGLLPEAASLVAAARPPQLDLSALTVEVLPVADAPVLPSLGWVVLGLATLAVAVASALATVRWAWALVRLRRVRGALEAAPPAVQSLLDDTRGRLAVRQPVEAALCAPEMAPFTFGWRHPVVAVPGALDGEALRLAVAHELAHVRHRDFLWNAIEQGVAAFGVAHPLVGVLARGTALGREQAADAAVLASQPSERRAYADLLFSYASLPAPGLTLGAAQGSSSLHTRIEAMKDTFSPARLRQLAVAGRAFGLVLAAALIGAATALAVPEAAAALTPFDTLEGRVTDATTGEGIRAANVLIVDTQIGAAANAEGYYKITRRPEGALELRVVAPGYEPRTVQVAPDQAEVDVALEPSSQADIAAIRARADSMRARMEEMRDQPRPDGIYEVVSRAPSLEGGLRGLQERVVYPQEAKDDGVQGRVFVTFIVDETGQVQDATIARSPSPLLSEAALAAVRESTFEPGRTESGEAVKVRYSLPVNFVLREDGTEETPERALPQAPRPDVFEVVEQAPRLIGGLEGLQRRVVYPAEAKEAGIEGRVFVTFIVDEQGRVQDPEVARSAGPLLDEAALKAVRESEFEPGQQRGVAVKVRYSLPINFSLPNPTQGDGRDRGSNRSVPAESGRVSYSGLDLATLENGSVIGERIRSIPATLAPRDAAPGTAVVQYLVQSDGRTSGAEITENTSDGALGEVARSIVDQMITRKGRRPGTVWAGTFRVTYTRS